jgi:hypothetical protein
LKKNTSHYWAWFSKRKRNELLSNDKLIYATAPSMPLNIKWQNYSYSTTEKFFRRFFSWFLYILLYTIRKVFFRVSLTPVSHFHALLLHKCEARASEELFPMFQQYVL